MSNIAIRQQGEEFIIKFNQRDFNREFWIALYRQLLLEYFPQASELTQEDIDRWTEEIESDWYEKEGKPFLQGRGMPV